MRLYPTVPRRRAQTIAGDAAVVVLVLLFAWLGVKVHDSVAELRSLGQGLADAGGAVQQTSKDAGGAIRSGFDTAAGAVGGAPVVGGAVSDALRDGGNAAAGSVEKPGAAAGGQVVDTGRAAERKTLSTAKLLGWLTFLVPTILLLSRALPPRIHQVRTLTLAARVLRLTAPGTSLAAAGGPDPDRVRALAQRAAFHLPYGVLLHHTQDPMGDLIAGRHEPLLRALGEHEGLRLADVA